MDKIQKVLVKAGRKDLAQKYYEKVATGVEDVTTFKEFHNVLAKLINAVNSFEQNESIDENQIKAWANTFRNQWVQIGNAAHYLEKSAKKKLETIF